MTGVQTVPKKPEGEHTLTLSARERLHITGVTEVESYDESTALIHTQGGILSVEGQNLHIRRLTPESGEMLLDGKITAMYYTEEAKASSGGGGFFGRLFR